MWDKVWENVFRENEWGKYPGESLIRFVARNFYKSENRPSVKILEVGCGPGANLWYMFREGFSVVGIDGSPTAVKQAQERLEVCENTSASSRGTYSVVEGDIISLPFPDAMFDAVIDVEAVATKPYLDAQQMYQEMARVAKPGGKCYSRMFADGIWGCPVSGEAQEGPLAGHGYKRITRYEEISDLMQGWREVIIDMECHTIGGFQQQHWVKEWIAEAIK